MFIWNITEKYVYSGTRPLVKFGGIYPFLHIILALVPIYWPFWPIINGLICTTGIIYVHYRWVQVGENDMESFKLQGPFRPGMKRFKSEEYGNDCILFYPVNKSNEPTKVPAYQYLDEYLKGANETGSTAFGVGDIKFRLVSHLCPGAPLDPTFAQG
jgi:hypothetical protein